MLEISGILGKDKIALGSDKGNLFVYFPSSQQEFERKKATRASADAHAFTRPTFSFLDQINEVRLSISPALRGRPRSRTLRHEFCHALGLPGHSKRLYKEEHLLGMTVYGSIELHEKQDSKPAVIPEADVMAVKLLYQESIPNGLKKSTFEQYLKEHKLQ